LTSVAGQSSSLISDEHKLSRSEDSPKGTDASQLTSHLPLLIGLRLLVSQRENLGIKSL